jgi:class 3 adenylate cyclase/tetratricopeptide (TPR) repeat protein
MDVGGFLRTLGLQQYEPAFTDNGIDARVLAKLTAEDLKDLGVTMVGHRRLLLAAIAKLRESPPPVETARGEPDDALMLGIRPVVPRIAERRQVTVMFCDLIDSTPLSSRLDPEEMSEIIRAYQACVTETINQFNGFIARYVGDGVLTYFGWPKASETDAECAVHAALAVATTVSAAPLGGQPLQVRIGIATGLVVVGEPIGSGESRQQTAIGETPNIAARLQGLAGPNEVVIDATTRRQIGGLFECRDLGNVALKGFIEKVAAWRVLRASVLESRFEALHGTTTPFIGREEEVELLLRRWTQAKTGNGRVVLISSEPGVGKSRLAEVLAGQITDEPHLRLRYFCSPHFQDSALYPVIAQMQRAAGLAHADTPGVRLAKIQTMLAAAAPSKEDLALIADLHSLPLGEPVLLREVSPQRRKEDTLQALLQLIDRLSRQQPVLVIFEDVHWIDPSSHELLDRVIERVLNRRVLLVATSRTEFHQSWVGQPQVTMLTLSRLDRRNTAAMVANVAGRIVLPPEIVDEIAERTDGVPLFVEELTKAVLESSEADELIVSALPQATVRVPATLHASLMARLDRLGHVAKSVAQTGSAIGREFGYGLLQLIINLPEEQLQEALEALTTSGLLLVRGSPPDSSYLFKHALVQDVAYSTLLRNRRQQLHGVIATALEEQFPDVVVAQPALLARHCAEAGLANGAISYWSKAGQQALARSAMTEAAAHLREALRVLRGMPASGDQRQRELELQIALARALIGAKGYSAPGTGVALERARNLSDELGDTANLIRIAHWQWTFHLMRAEMKEAGRIAQELLIRSEQHQTIDLRLNGHRLVGATLIQVGKIASGCSHLERAQSILHGSRESIGDVIQGNDALVGVPAFRAIGLALLGRYGEARKQSRAALAEANRAARAHRKAFALAVAGCWFHGLLNEDVPELHDDWAAIAEEREFPFWHAYVIAWRGLRVARGGEQEEGLALVHKGTAQLMALGAAWGPPFFLANAALLAPCENQFPLLDEASRLIASTGVAWFAPELERIRGVLTRENGDCDGAEHCFQRALEEARGQGSKHWELRTTLSLVDLWLDAGRTAGSRALLEPIYSHLQVEGETDDLLRAAALLAQL